MANKVLVETSVRHIHLTAEAVEILYGKGAELIDSASADGKSPNLVWVYEHVFAAIPALAMVLVAELFYLGKDRYIPITTHTEKSIIFGGVIFFIYALMLPCVLIASPETIDPETGNAIESLWTRTYEWFFAQILPFGIVMSILWRISLPSS